MQKLVYTAHGILTSDHIDKLYLFIYKNMNPEKEIHTVHFPSDFMLNDIITYEFIINKKCIDYVKERIDLLNKINLSAHKNIIERKRTNDVLIYNNNIYSCLAYDLYIHINCENIIENVFNKGMILYLFSVDIVDNITDIYSFLLMFNLDMDLINRYVILLKQVTKPDMFIILLNNIEYERIYYILLKKILSMENIEFLLYENNKLVDDSITNYHDFILYNV